MGAFPSTTSAIEVRLVNPSATDFDIGRVPAGVHADRPLEVEIAAIGHTSADAGAAESKASWISAHALLQVYVSIPGQAREKFFVQVIARPSISGWIIRVLVRPAAWADAVSVTIESLSFAGRPLPCDFLPVNLRVGYNQELAPAGSVIAAVVAGDVPALKAVLDAGGSTEEADEVSGYLS